MDTLNVDETVTVKINVSFYNCNIANNTAYAGGVISIAAKGAFSGQLLVKDSSVVSNLAAVSALLLPFIHARFLLVFINYV